MTSLHKEDADEKEYSAFRGGSRALRSFNDGGKRVCVKVLMTEDERAALQDFARLHGKSMSVYVRDKALYSSARLDNDSLKSVQSELRTLVRQIRGEATNVNQLAHWSNAKQELHRDADGVASELRMQARKLSSFIDRLEQLV